MPIGSSSMGLGIILIVCFVKYFNGLRVNRYSFANAYGIGL